jgi:hypothetical protein
MAAWSVTNSFASSPPSAALISTIIAAPLVQGRPPAPRSVAPRGAQIRQERKPLHPRVGDVLLSYRTVLHELSRPGRIRTCIVRFRKPAPLRSATGRRCWQPRQGSNLRPPGSEPGALPTELRGSMVGPGGVEPPTQSFGGSGLQSLSGPTKSGGLCGDRTRQCLLAKQVSPHCDLEPMDYACGVEPH